MSPERCHNIADLRRLAQKNLPAPIFHYIDGGADDEVSLRRNTAAFDDFELLPTQLSDVSRIATRSRLFGQEIDWPLLISPTGGSRLFHGDGEIAVARAAADQGLPYSLSTVGTTSIADVAAVHGGPKVFQLYVFKDRGITREFIALCREHAYAALCLTVDTPVAGNRERDFVYGFSAAPRSPKLRARQVASYLAHPYWLYRALVRKDLELVNLTRCKAAPDIDKRVRDFIDRELDRSMTWKDVEWLASEWDGALVVKGVQTVADCRRAAESGATAVMLSNHGGRQLESSPAPVDCVAPVADALHGRLEIICDGGIRRGNHIVKALAAGATACSIGRAYLYGLGAGGYAGVSRALAILREEFERTLALVGCNDVAKLGRTFLGRRP